MHKNVEYKRLYIYEGKCICIRVHIKINICIYNHVCMYLFPVSEGRPEAVSTARTDGDR
jgi:hypothetical protein